MKYTTTQLEQAVDTAGSYFQDLYLEWVNNYLTITEFAFDKGITEKQARLHLKIGRKVHNKRTSK